MTNNLLNNRYQILQTLARGGFGETFLATDTYMPSSRKCVIKQLKPAVQYPVIPQWLQERFQREATILEELGEKNAQIPRLYAYFSESANFYLVQEWIDGQTLTQRQQQGNLSEEQVKEILVNLLPVLAFIHDRKIIHRDLKPDNIILRYSDGLPVLIDFGAMKEAVATVAHPGHSTFTVISGTPGYMSSEQAAGRPVYSSDLYGLGLTAIYLLTGQTPQELETDPATGEILWQRETNKHSNLASVIDRAIRFHPRDRFKSATDMLQALSFGEVSQLEPTIAVSPGNPQTLKPIPSPHPVTVPVLDPTKLEERPRNSKIGCFLPALLFMGVIFGSFLIGFQAFMPKFPERPKPTPTLSPEFSEPEPTPEPTPTLEPIPIPKPKPKPRPEPTPTPTPESIPIPVPPPEEPIPSPEPTPEPTPTPSPELTPLPEETPTPTPEPLQPLPSPEPEVSPQTQSQFFSPKVPIFPIGTVKSSVLNTLGTPTYIKKGLWGDSQAVRYQDLIPDQVDLGYLIDNKTGQIRQTEITFMASVSLKTIKGSLNQLLLGNTTPSIKQGLEQVYLGQRNKYSFIVGSTKGTIERQKSNHIYIGIWDANFHD